MRKHLPGSCSAWAIRSLATRAASAGVVGDGDDLAGAVEPVVRAAGRAELGLGQLHVDVAGPGDEVDLPDRLGAVAQGRRRPAPRRCGKRGRRPASGIPPAPAAKYPPRKPPRVTPPPPTPLPGVGGGLITLMFPGATPATIAGTASMISVLNSTAVPPGTQSPTRSTGVHRIPSSASPIVTVPRSARHHVLLVSPHVGDGPLDGVAELAGEGRRGTVQVVVAHLEAVGGERRVGPLPHVVHHRRIAAAADVGHDGAPPSGPRPPPATRWPATPRAAPPGPAGRYRCCCRRSGAWGLCSWHGIGSGCLAEAAEDAEKYEGISCLALLQC